MRRQLQRIYWMAIGLTVIMALTAVGLLVYVRVQDTRESMRSILYTASAWTEESTEDLHSLADRIASAAPPLRVTFILEQGLVLADSQADLSQMENHMNRPEIVEARSGGIGEDMRRSETEGILTLYAAVRISPRLFLRLSYPLEEIMSLVKVCALGVGVLFLGLYGIQRGMLARFARRMVGQMEAVGRLLDGENARLEEEGFEEFRPAMRAIEYRVRRLNEDVRQIQKTQSLRESFVTNASHELKSPLTSIRGFAELLSEGMDDSPEERAMYLECILNECDRMRDVIEDILMLGRAGAPVQQTVQPVEVRRTAEEVACALGVRARQRSIRLEIQGELRVEAAEKDIWEILYNLADNAIRYGREGGWVHIRLEPGLIAVEDNGAGLAPEHIPLLFEPFFRVEGADGRGGGTGLGLPIVKKLAEKYRAQVKVESRLGEGSRFEIRFVREM